MSKLSILIILVILVVVVILGMQFLTPHDEIINVDGHNLILPSNYTYESGNNTNVVTVSNNYNQKFAITTDSMKNYYGDMNFTSVTPNGADVTYISGTNESTDPACLINDNGTTMIVDCIDSGSAPATLVFELAEDLQKTNNITKGSLY